MHSRSRPWGHQGKQPTGPPGTYLQAMLDDRTIDDGAYKRCGTVLTNWLIKTGKQVNCRSVDLTNVRRKLTLAQLEKVAQSIVNSSNPSIVVPLEIISAVQVIVAGRRETHECHLRAYAVNPSPEIAQKNDSHRHALTVHENILAFLQLSSKSRHVTSTSSPESSVHDCGDGYESATENSITCGPGLAAGRPKACIKDIPAIFSLLSDLSETRLWVKKIWRGFNVGEISFIAVSKMTDMAFRKCQELITVFEAEYSCCCSYQAILRGWDLNDDVWIAALDMSTSGGVHKSDTGLLAEVCSYMPAYRVTHYITGRMFQTRTGSPDTGARPVLSQSGALHPFLESLVAVVSQLCSLSDDSHGHSAGDPLDHELDTFTHELLKSRPGEESMLLVAMMRMHLDIYDSLAGDLQRDMVSSRQILCHLEAAKHRFFQFYTGCNDNSQANGTTKCLSELMGHLSLAECRSWRTSVRVPNELLKTLPLLRGAHVWDCLTRHHRLSIVLCKAKRSEVAAAHLHKTLVPCVEWPGMDLLLSIVQGPDSCPDTTSTNTVMGHSIHASDPTSHAGLMSDTAETAVPSNIAASDQAQMDLVTLLNNPESCSLPPPANLGLSQRWLADLKTQVVRDMPSVQVNHLQALQQCLEILQQISGRNIAPKTELDRESASHSLAVNNEARENMSSVEEEAKEEEQAVPESEKRTATPKDKPLQALRLASLINGTGRSCTPRSIEYHTQTYHSALPRWTAA